MEQPVTDTSVQTFFLNVESGVKYQSRHTRRKNINAIKIKLN